MDSLIASSDTVWIMAGKGAAIMLPVLAVAILVTLVIALRHDRRLRGGRGNPARPTDPTDSHAKQREKNA